MVVSEELVGQRVIIIDDLYGSGGTMQEAGRALRAAGASEVLGLAVTKQRLYEGVSLATQD
jgi:predicted amidophosphoribosyltransferase